MQVIIAVRGVDLAASDVLVEVAFDVALLVFAFGLFFVVSGRTTHWAISALGGRFRERGLDPETGEASAIRDLLASDRVPPMAEHVSGRQIAVFVSGHTHVRVHRTEDGLAVELWDHPRPADLRLPVIERLAVAGRMPSAPPPGPPPRLVARQTTGPGADDRP
jgi:hypothetical protein